MSTARVTGGDFRPARELVSRALDDLAARAEWRSLAAQLARAAATAAERCGPELPGIAGALEHLRLAIRDLDGGPC